MIWIGRSIVIMACVILGWNMSYEYEMAIINIRQLMQILEYMMNHIQTEKDTIPDAIKKTSRQIKGEMSNVLEKIAEEILYEHGDSLCAIWKEQMSDTLIKVPKDMMEIFVNVFDHVGYYDSKEQVSRLSQVHMEMEKHLETLEKQKNDKCRLLKSMWMLGGIFVVILLW